MSVNSVMTELADAIRRKSGKGIPLTLSAMIETVNNIQTGGTGTGSGISAIVDEQITIPAPIDTHMPAYENGKLLGNIDSFASNGLWHIVLFLPVDVPTAKMHTTRALISCPDLPASLAYIRTSNGSDLAEFMPDLIVIQKGIVHVGPHSASAPLASGTYRLLVIA